MRFKVSPFYLLSPHLWLLLILNILTNASLSFQLAIVIPKANNVFTVQIRQSVFTVHGNHFCFRASQRSNKKFKPKPTIDL